MIARIKQKSNLILFFFILVAYLQVLSLYLSACSRQIFPDNDTEGAESHYYQFVTSERKQSKPVKTNPPPPEGPLISLLTTFSDMPSRKVIEKNTVRNWASFMPFLKPYAFAEEDSPISKLARRYGWTVWPLEASGGMSDYGIPYLSSMLDTICNTSNNSAFIGYANSDILFSASLLKTLEALREQELLQKDVLLIGQRKELDKFDSYYDMKDIDQPIYSLRRKPHYTAGFDLFIYNHCYSWKDLPNFIVGYPRFDMYLPMSASLRNFSLINLSNTVDIVHQRSKSHWLSFSRDSKLANLDILETFIDVRKLLSKEMEKRFNSSLWFTKTSRRGTIMLSRHDNATTQPLMRWLKLRRAAFLVHGDNKRDLF